MTSRSRESDTAVSSPRPRWIAIDRARQEYLPLLEGPPATVSMRSGYVVLQPGNAVGQHTTGNHEEVLVVLEGTGEFRLAGVPAIPLAATCVAYCPPDTVHDVINTGSSTLRYIYVVAKAWSG